MKLIKLFISDSMNERYEYWVHLWTLFQNLLFPKENLKKKSLNPEPSLIKLNLILLNILDMSRQLTKCDGIH
jgi:hypothetical protein